MIEPTPRSRQSLAYFLPVLFAWCLPLPCFVGIPAANFQPCGHPNRPLNTLLNTSGKDYILTLFPGEQHFVTTPLRFGSHPLKPRGVDQRYMAGWPADTRGRKHRDGRPER